MKRLLPVILLITVLPTFVLVGAALLVGQKLFLAESQAAEEFTPSTGPSGISAASNPQDDEWISLFDGKTLDGWEGNEEFFRVEEKAIVAGNLKAAIPRNEFLCTKKTFKNFELRLEAKLIGPGENAGVQFRSRRIPDHHEVIGYQCDIGQANGRSIWGLLYDESRRRKFLVEVDQEQVDKNTLNGRWNRLVIRCEGDRVRIWLNDYPTVDYVEPDAEVARAGLIGLQIHSGPPAEAWYRNLRIKILD